VSNAGPAPASLLARLADLGPRLAQLWSKEIWKSSNLNDNSPRGWCYAALRAISITVTVFFETKVPARAAALSFSSLLGLGPLVAIAVLIGGFVLGNNSDPNLVATRLGEIIEKIVPQLKTLESVDASGNVAAPAMKSQIVTLINGFVTSARSGSAGVFGALSLIFIVLLLFKSVEDAFNDIWGVRLGRSLLMRVVFYWTTLTLGAVLFFGAIAMLGAGAAVNVFQGPLSHLPGGQEIFKVLQWFLPAFSVTLLVVLLTLVYRVIPNTRVFWRAAFAGALVVATLILLNNFVALFYVRRVILTKSLYGSLALPIVLMLGLYIFWLYLLIGGVISYAVQNVHFRNSQAAWTQLNENMRERLSLVVLLTIGRRFQDCLPPVTAGQLGELLKVPTQIINECLNRLVEMQLITTLRPAPDAPATEHRYQPARPLSRMTLYDFKTLDDNLGEDPVGQGLERVDPILRDYDAALGKIGEQEFFQKSLDQLISEHPFDVSRPPFALGERVQAK
jgi:membrane protein